MTDFDFGYLTLVNEELEESFDELDTVLSELNNNSIDFLNELEQK
jgi:hypothetical protein